MLLAASYIWPWVMVLEVGARGIDRRLDVARGAIDVTAEVELQRDARLADAALRRHLGDVGDLAEMTFERLGDAGGDGFRTGAGKLRADRDGREIDLRQRRHRQSRESHNAGERDRQRQQRRRHRPRDEWCGNVHSAGSFRTIGPAGRRPVTRTARRSK
jgi:hypothetical protein